IDVEQLQDRAHLLRVLQRRLLPARLKIPRGALEIVAAVPRGPAARHRYRPPWARRTNSTSAGETEPATAPRIARRTNSASRCCFVWRAGRAGADDCVIVAPLRRYVGRNGSNTRRAADMRCAV